MPSGTNAGQLARAILCYQQQTWKDKELIVIDDKPWDLAPLLEDIPNGELQYIRSGTGSSDDTDLGGDLARIKNLGLEKATGEFVIHWDASDWHHPERIRHQVAGMESDVRISWMAGTLLHIDHPELVHHPYVDTPKGGYSGSLIHVNDPAKRYPPGQRDPDRAFLSLWDTNEARKMDASDAWLIVRSLQGDSRNRRRFYAGLRKGAGDFTRWMWVKLRGRDRLSHPRFRLSAQAQISFRRYLQESRKMGLITSIA
ncbi:MAG: glycosyltransferase family 2 protein [Balneolaceae bacterium]|nr:MAG: glycosyltransferase family 2 protein [Balneolaceae bacterium]